MNYHRCFFFLCALVLATVGYSQERVQNRGIEMRGGKVVGEVQSATASGSVGPKIQIWTDRKNYLPGEEIRVLAMGLTSDATNLQIFVGETFTNLATGEVVAHDNYPCPCADSNAGYVANLANFNFMTLFARRTMGLRPGYYDFYILVMKPFDGDGLPRTVYQNTHLRVGVLAPIEDGNPIRIDELHQIMESRQRGTAALVLRGRFPVGEPLYFFVGTAPYEGMLNPGSIPPLSSNDGLTLVVPLASPFYYGRVILMTPDGSFSTISRQEFAPMAALPTLQ